jgi:hypothetical protein
MVLFQAYMSPLCEEPYIVIGFGTQCLIFTECVGNRIDFCLYNGVSITISACRTSQLILFFVNL